MCVCVRARQSALCMLHINRLVNHGHLQPTHTPNSHAPTKLIFCLINKIRRPRWVETANPAVERKSPRGGSVGVDVA